MRLSSLLLPLALVALVGCGSSGDDNSTFQLRAVHASPDAGAVDIYISGAVDLVLRGVPYGAASDFIDAPQGVYNIAIRGAGADAESDPVFFENGIDLSSNESAVTVIAAGFVNGGNDDGFRLLKLLHDFDTPGANQAIARIVHAGADAPPVGIDLDDNGSVEAVVGRFVDTGAAGVLLPAATPLQVGIRLDDLDSTRVTAFTTPALPAGAELFVIATGRLSSLPRQDDGFALLAVGPDGAIGFIKQNPTVYALHAGPDAPPVEVFTGNTRLSDAISFGQLTQPIQVPPGSYPISLVAGGQSALDDVTPTLAAGERYLVVARGFLPQAEKELTLDYIREQFDIDDTTSLAVVGHASPDAPPVELGVVVNGNFTPLGLDDLMYGDETDLAGTDIGTAALTLGVRASGQQAIVAQFNLAPMAGERVFALAIGALVTEDANPFVAALINTATSPWTAIVAAPVVEDE